MPSFVTAYETSAGICSKVFDQYEKEVNVYGYSLLRPLTVWESELIRKYSALLENE
jgi:hypothetical protein